MARREVCVAHRHRHRLVTHQLLDRAEVTSRHRKPGGEGVAEVMLPEVDDAGSLHRGEEVAVQKVLRVKRCLPRRAREDVGAL